MRNAATAASISIGAGVTLASAFASSLGLSVLEQRVGFALGLLLIAVGVAMYFKQRGRGEVEGPGDTFVTSFNQSGGIIAGTVNICEPQQPRLEFRVTAENEQHEDGYHQIAEVTVVHPLSIPNLGARIETRSLQSVTLAPITSGSGFFQGNRATDYASVHNATGRLRLEVVTAEPISAMNPMKVMWSFT